MVSQRIQYDRRPAASRKGDEGVNSPTFGTLPDFGNFDDGSHVYQSVRKLMKYDQAVSACNRLLKRLRASTPSRDAIKEVYGLSFAELEVAWRAWVQENYPKR